MNISHAELERLVRDILHAIPAVFRKRFDNVEFTLEDTPPAHIRQELNLHPLDILLGLYQGVPRTRRGSGYGNVLPDKITIYRHSLELLCSNRDELQRELEEVVHHEIGHYFGLEEEDLKRIERTRRHAITRRLPT